MKKRGRPESRTWYQKLGDGGLNCIIGESDGKNYNIVYRIGRTKGDFGRESMFERADGILSLLNESPNAFGPSLMSMAKDTERIPFVDLPEQMKDILYLCPPFKDIELVDNEVVYKQTIEYLYGGDMGNSLHIQNFESTVFMLMWFLYTTQAQYGFRHRDIKPGNIVFRDMGRPTQFLFKLGKDSWYLFKARHVPVVIDYDFASIFVTNIRTRNAMGTYTTVPPRHNITYLVRKAQKKRILGSIIEDDASFDWYSLGITLLRWLFGSFKTNNLKPHLYVSHTEGSKDLDAFENEVIQRLDLDSDDAEVDKLITSVYCKLRVMHLMGSINNRYINQAHLDNSGWVEVLQVFLDTFDPSQNDEYAQMEYALDRAIQEYGDLVNKLFPILLSPEKDDRTATGEPWRLFEYLFDGFPEYPQGVETPYTYTYGIHPIFDVTTTTKEYSQKRRAQIVQKMAQAMQRFHSIAGQVMCINCHQQASHISTDKGEFYCSRDCAIARNRMIIHKN